MSPRYSSTRGGHRATFSEALLNGLAPDGGLYVPEDIPDVPLSAWQKAAQISDLAFSVLHRWIGDEIEEPALRAIVEDALDFAVPLHTLGGRGWRDVYVLELFHGPTLSFKDFGARTMARLMGRFLSERDEELTILVATSGDTGSAVADGFAGQEPIDVLLLYPEGKVSPVQERQLIVRRPGVRTLAVQGTFDDCQRMVKAAFVDPSLADVKLSSANSINIGRLLPQMVYYLWAVRELGGPATFCVPSGNLGNLTAGILAYLSGMPAHGFIAAHNANDAFPRYLRGEDVSFGPTVLTLSNAMDVGAPSNFERLESLLTADEIRSLINGISVTDEETIESMRRLYGETGYIADPHTAVGLEAVRGLRSQRGWKEPAVVLATAHPAKFPEIVREALGFEPEAPPQLAELWDREVASQAVAPSLEALRTALLAGG